jgi:nucleotide-binding universal stress UspA family protein
MKTLLVPVDFSGPSENAAAFAADLANDRGYDEVVLAANLYVPIFEQIIPSPDLLQVTAADIQQKKKLIREQLEDLKSTLLNRLNRQSTKVRFVISDLPLVRAILQQVRDESPALIIIGSNSLGATDSSMIGRQIIELAKVIPAPVLIVPPKSSYLPVTDALVAGDFKSLACIDPLKLLGKLIHGPHPRLLLLDVGASRRNLPAADPSAATKDAVSDLLKGFDYKLYNLEDKDILQGVLNFADGNPVQMIIALPGRHSFLYHLTHQNIQRGILLNAQKPVLILR